MMMEETYTHLEYGFSYVDFPCTNSHLWLGKKKKHLLLVFLQEGLEVSYEHPSLQHFQISRIPELLEKLGGQDE